MYVRSSPHHVANNSNTTNKYYTLSLHDALPICEHGVRGGGDHRHQVAMLGVGDLPVRLLPRTARGDEDDLVQPEHALDLAGGDEVTVVDRVEGSTHHTDPAPLLLHRQRSELLSVFPRLRWFSPRVR